ncbi:hopanoid C-3 methylase HpnR [Acidibrevibacterium fodinaquatile]|uniref:hopanoid C-3 methylase HpnR n=1 Tax=Acidibrevibacterium fodinaquatile TaxID=1969806 RepID=UPI000E0D98A5|nr:hopanoid C-3 methylase HpnR [Acidibrevibacterium fodinaquatile]
MRLLCVHPGPLMYTKVFLRLEPLGLELVAAAALAVGHAVRLIDLQVESHRAYFREIGRWRPDVIAFSCNYLANVPEIVDLAKETKHRWPNGRIVVGGHSASFVAHALLEHGDGAIDCVLRGEGEAAMPLLLATLARGGALHDVPGAVTPEGEGPKPAFVEDLNALRPARHLLRHRRKYFIGPLDPCASIEFSRGCPWDCTFCSAWTFYGRSYRLIDPEHAVADLKTIREPGVFIVDDVAFIRPEHGMAIGEAIARRGLRKEYYLETRGDVLLRNKDVFRFWKTLGLRYLFLGLEAIDEEGLARYRKRVPLSRNFEALEFARSLGIHVAVNIIVDPDWDEARFAAARQWCLEVPEIVNISVNTPYPGTESWMTEERQLTSRDYRLFDIQHCVLPTKLPLAEFYRELVATQRVLNMKHLGWRTLLGTAGLVARHLRRGQTNFLQSLFRFNSVYDPTKLLADHALPVAYEVPLPTTAVPTKRAAFYVHQARGERDRALDAGTRRFVVEAGARPFDEEA